MTTENKNCGIEMKPLPAHLPPLPENYPFNLGSHTSGGWYAWCDALYYCKNESEREGGTISDATKLKAYEVAKKDPRWETPKDSPIAVLNELMGRKNEKG